MKPKRSAPLLAMAYWPVLVAVPVAGKVLGELYAWVGLQLPAVVVLIVMV